MKYFKHCLYILFFFICISVQNVYGQTRVLKSLSVSDGLSGSIVYVFYKDSTGYMWMGTENGLDRYDGVHFRHYGVEGNGTKVIDAVAETTGGEIIAGNASGLWQVDDIEGKLKPIARETVNCGVNALLPDGKGGLLVASYKGLFYLGKNGRWRRLLLDGNLLSNKNYINRMALNGNLLWIATQRGFYSIRLSDFKVQNRVEPFGQDDQCSFVSIACVGQDVFLGTDVRGLFKYDTSTRTFKAFADVGSPVIKSLSSNPEKHLLYVGTDGNGVHFLSSDTGAEVYSLTHVPDKLNALRSNSIYSLLVDRDGIIWVGEYQTGVDYTLFQDGAFTLYSFPPLFDSYNMIVRALAVHGRQRLIGTRDGLYFVDEQRNVVRSYSSPQLKSKLILCCYYSDGKYYVGTFRGGVYELDPETGVVRDFVEGQKSDDPGSIVFCITKAPDGNLWMGTSDGIYCYRNGHMYEHYSKANSQLPGNNVMSIYFDASGKGWIGTEQGLCVYDPSSKSLRPDIFPDGFFQKQSIQNIFQDHKGTLYFSAANGTLYVSDPDMKRFGTFLPNLFTNGLKCMFVAQDKEKRLWFGTNNGLYRYDKQGIHPYAFIDGLPGSIFLSCPPVLDENGRLWLGNTQGVVYYRDKVSDVHFLPYAIRVTDVVMNGVSIGGEVIRKTDKGDRIQVDIPKNGDLTVCFSNFSYTQTASLSYEYMLEGLDDAWKPLKGRSDIKWYNLSSGSYKLRIRWAAMPETEVRIPFNVGTPIGEGLTAIFIVLVLIGSGVGVLYYWRKRGRFLFHKVLSVIKADGKKDDDENTEVEKYRTMKVSEEDCLLLKDKLENLMLEKKPYLNPELKLKDVAQMLRTPVHQLSYMFNMSMHMRYNDYINRCRIEEFKRVVASEDVTQYTIEALAERCGFSSKTSFFRNFKAQEGITPNEFVRIQKH